MENEHHETSKYFSITHKSYNFPLSGNYTY